MKKEEQKCTVSIPTSVYPLFGDAFATGIVLALAEIKSAPEGMPPSSTDASANQVRYPHAVSVESVYKLKDISSHHCACIQAKKYATVGLGFVDKGDKVTKAADDEQAREQVASLLTGQAYVRSKVDETLDRLTHFGFNNELLDAVEDFEDTGTGYLEVVRDSSGEIARISQVSVADVWPCTEGVHLYYYYKNPVSGVATYFSKFGKSEKEWLMNDGPYRGSKMEPEKVSELIPFILPSNRTKYQGYPEWISASTDIDLLKKAKQYKADFYHNRGILDYIVSVTGTSLDSPQWEAIVENIKAVSATGARFKNMAVNLGDPDAKLEVHKMAMEMKTEDQFAKDNETLAQNIVSAHRVPPLLANILIPGKLGASNEFVSALMGFQLLVVGPQQNIIQSMLAATLGGPDGIPDLSEDDFRLRTITSQINLTGMDTMGKMRSEAVDGNKNGDRDLNKGVKD